MLTPYSDWIWTLHSHLRHTMTTWNIFTNFLIFIWLSDVLFKSNVYVLHPYPPLSSIQASLCIHPSQCGLWSCFFFHLNFDQRTVFFLCRFFFWSCLNNIHYSRIFPLCFVFISHGIDSKQKIVYNNKIRMKKFLRQNCNWMEWKGCRWPNSPLVTHFQWSIFGI